MDAKEETKMVAAAKRLNLFERYLTVWVGLCMVAGLLLGKFFPAFIDQLMSMEFGKGSQVNVPIAILISMARVFSAFGDTMTVPTTELNPFSVALNL